MEESTCPSSMGDETRLRTVWGFASIVLVNRCPRMSHSRVFFKRSCHMAGMLLVMACTGQQVTERTRQMGALSHPTSPCPTSIQDCALCADTKNTCPRVGHNAGTWTFALSTYGECLNVCLKVDNVATLGVQAVIIYKRTSSDVPLGLLISCKSAHIKT